MKYITLTMSTLILGAGTTCLAQPQQKLNIESATVFLSGAELTSTAKLSLVKGENEIKFINVAGDVNNQSIVANASNGVLVESVTFQNNYLATDNVSPKAKEIKDSIELVTLQQQTVDTKIKVLTEELTILQNNRKVGGDKTGLSVAELQKLLDLVSTKMEGYYNQRTKEENNQKKINEHLARLNAQLEEEQKTEYQPGGMLVIKFYAKEATSSNVTVSYVVNNAGWTPTYDVVAEDIKNPIKFYYKANIFQNSGVKWNNVHLTLSTGNPQEGMQAPTLAPWYLAFYTPPAVAYKKAVRRRGEEAREDNNTYAWGAAAEPAVTGSASYSLSAVANATTISEYVAVDNSGVNTSFDIDLPYTIPSDGQQHLVAVKKYEVPATYQYFAIPKLDKDAFLQAQITNWEDLNLMAGPTNIFYEGTYVGQGRIDPSNVKDTLYLSLGRDKKIVIKKERDKNLKSVKMIGSNVREAYSYTITVRNTRKEPATIILQDQQPVSNDKDIELEDKDTGGSEYDEATGLMKWTVKLAPNESKKLTFGYTVKYPKGKIVTGLK